jgi:hypothetical protein
MKIRELKEEFLKLDQLIEEEAEMIDPETGEFISNEEKIRELTEKLKKEKSELLDYLADKRLELKAEEALFAEKIKQLQEKKKALSNRQAKLLDTIDYVLEGQKFKSAEHSYYYQKTESVEIIDENDIPAEFIDFEPKINKTELKKHLKAGEEVKGAILKETIGVRIR